MPSRAAPAARILRLLFAVLAAACGIVVIRRGAAEAQPAASWALGLFCLVLALACALRGRPARFFGSLAAFTICLLGLYDLVAALRTGAGLFDLGGEHSLPAALFFLVCFGWPAAAYVWRARFGLGRGGGKDA